MPAIFIIWMKERAEIHFCLRVTSTHPMSCYLYLLSEVTLNSQPVKPQEELSCRAGQCLQLGISVHNFLERSLWHVCLAVQFYQDHQNGVNNYRLETRLASAGASRVILPEVSSILL